MRIFVDAHILDDLGQGSKTYLRGLYADAIKQDPRNDFYFASNSLENFRNQFDSTQRVHHLQYSSHNRLYRLGVEISSLIRENKIDWAHFQYISPLKKVCNEIVTIHDLLFLDFPRYFPSSYKLTRGFLFRKSARRAEYVLTVSEYSREALQRHYNIPPEKIVVTPNGVLDVFWESLPGNFSPPLNLLPGQFLLYVSRFEPRKNQHGLLQSYLDLELWKKGMKLVLVGGHGVPSPEFQNLIASLSDDVRQSVMIIDGASLNDLRWLYANCGLFVYPSFAEGFGIPPLEAIACGANVICSGTTAMSEFKFLGSRLFDPHRENEMTEKIQFFLDHPETENRNDIQAFVKMNYSWSESAARFLRIFR